MVNLKAMIRVFATVALCALMTACSSGAAHRVFVAMRATRYIQAHGGQFKNYMTIWIPAGGMLPTLPVGSMALVDKAAFRKPGSTPSRGDIIVFRPPFRIPNLFIKRVIALPGDRFRIERGTVYINGHALVEDYTKEPAHYAMTVHGYGLYVREPGGPEQPLDPAYTYLPPRSDWPAPDRVPPDCYILLGDNRNDSLDSHQWGCVRRKSILGKVVEIYT